MHLMTRDLSFGGVSAIVILVVLLEADKVLFDSGDFCFRITSLKMLEHLNQGWRFLCIYSFHPK